MFVSTGIVLKDQNNVEIWKGVLEMKIPLKIFWLFSAEKWGTYIWGLRDIPWCQRTPTVVQPTSPPFFCYTFFVYQWASIILAAIFITRPVFFVKIQGYHILLWYRHVGSHSYHILLLSLRTPFFVALLSAQIARNLQIQTRPYFVCYIRSFSTNFGLLDCTPLIGKIGARGKCRC